MIPRYLGHRERLMSLWAKDRLGERATVDWAVTALKQIRGTLGEQTAALFEFLSNQAQQNIALSDDLKKVWRLLYAAAKDGLGQNDSFMAIHEIKKNIKEGTISSDDVDRIVTCFRPRLTAKPLSSWARSSEDETLADPMRWVRWEFETTLNDSYMHSAQLNRQQLLKFADDRLIRLLERSTSALHDALVLAEELEWMDGIRDLPNYHVHRVFISDEELRNRPVENSDDDAEHRDPDYFNNDFAPIVRVLSGSLDALAQKNIGSAQTVAERWSAEKGGLFERLFAFGCWDGRLVSTDQVATFLLQLNSQSFWRWMIFPEIASLRALRWNELSTEARSTLSRKLLQGPNSDAFLSETPVPEKTIEFHRDHELARLVDNNRNVPQDFHAIVNARRVKDPNFPKKVLLIERGHERPRVQWVPPGNPEAFANVSSEALLSALATAQKVFWEGDDAEAFARTPEGKRRILDALTKSAQGLEFSERAWNLLLSYPLQKNEGADLVRDVAEGTANLASQLPDDAFKQISAQLCYWLDWTDESCPDFNGARGLWQGLLPHASAQANAPDRQDKEGDEVDLTSAALNEPLGHLLSMFLRRCPSMPLDAKERPPLPLEFVQPLKQLSGRAKELLANRMAILMNYFVRADAVWLESFVLSAMRRDDAESNRLWEAFAKYGKAPTHETWHNLQPLILKQLSSPKLSPEAKNQLAHMAVIVWIWSKEKNTPFRIDVVGFRTALGLANDEVRASAAWQFARLFYRREEQDTPEEPSGEEYWPRLGAAFFDEIWPIEPGLQSPKTANDFAWIPVGVGQHYIREALEVVLPYLQPFEVWAVLTEFQLDPDKPWVKKLVMSFPEEILILLAVCISDKQQHEVHGIKRILDWISESRPDLEHDYRMRSLRRMERG